MIEEYEIKELANNRYQYEEMIVYAPNVTIAKKKINRMMKRLT